MEMIRAGGEWSTGLTIYPILFILGKAEVTMRSKGANLMKNKASSSQLLKGWAQLTLNLN